VGMEPTERIARIRAELLVTPYSVCLERPVLLDEFARTPEGRASRKEHPFVRRALALAYIYRSRKPRLYPGELIAGNMTSKRIAANYYPEGGSVSILEDVLLGYLRAGRQRRQIPLELTAAERRRLLSIGVRGIRGSVAGRALLRPGRIPYFLDFFRAKRYFITEEAVAHQVGGYWNVVHRGLRWADEFATRRLATGTSEDEKSPGAPPLTPDQVAFYRWCGSPSRVSAGWPPTWPARPSASRPTRPPRPNAGPNSPSRPRPAGMSPMSRPGPSLRVSRPTGSCTWP